MQILQQREEIPAEGHRYSRVRLAKDTPPAEIAVATGRWMKDQVYGLAFRRLSQPSDKQLTECVDAAGMAKE